MLNRTIMKAVLSVLLAIVGVSLSACSNAQESGLTGDVHERHASGIDSQVGDQ
ncbi:MAG: hypothetical protein JXA69_09515 [Phycisphaerae bacterium]|nr:hypothetical protein [Phycisphaerae bacterium]